MHIIALLSAAIAVPVVLATPIARSPYVVKETHYVPKEWKKLDRAHGSKTIQLQIGLKQGRFDELHRHLYEGEWLLQQQLCSMEAPVDMKLTAN